MTSKLSSFPQVQQFRSPLVKKPTDAVPPVEDLEQLLLELKQAKLRATERLRKAKHDTETIEESMLRLSEKEKGKAKAVDKVKRERDSADELKKKKKKRKREGGESDVEQELQRPRKQSPPVVHPPPPPKVPKPVIPATPSHTKPPIGQDFSLPPAQPLLSPRPPIPPPPIPGPSRPTEVTEDFSKQKPPQQVLVTTFYTSIEPYIRNIKEEDVGFLEYTGDEVEPYVMPKLGRHYLEIWEDQDNGVLPPILLGDSVAPASHFAAPAPKWDPLTLADQDLAAEERGHGPFTERVISALLPIPDLTVWKGVKAAEDAMEGRPGGSGAAAARKERLNVTDLEARIRDTMRYHGLLDAVPDFTEKVDDPIASALREAQRELRRVVAVNKARKARLVPVAKDRLGYQEYLELRDAIDKNITTLYAKLQKKDVPKLSKKKKELLVEVAKWSGDGLRTTCLKDAWPIRITTVVSKVLYPAFFFLKFCTME
ncbi:hypothetical protein NLJ89_g5350 [Agrocybe chaxingu]|uniref:Uncharacterized protein n=1 Tax=Agrocybe chaxingu TaxID=84603 RepID=A0A9W8K1A1_9AGAR|nr:hypothetical protein NLJ89_g5350 [Agrocybe chaxingu]